MKKPMCKIPQPCKYTLIDSSQKEISTARDMAAIGSNLFTSHPIQSKIKKIKIINLVGKWKRRVRNQIERSNKNAEKVSWKQLGGYKSNSQGPLF